MTTNVLRSFRVNEQTNLINDRVNETEHSLTSKFTSTHGPSTKKDPLFGEASRCFIGVASPLFAITSGYLYLANAALKALIKPRNRPVVYFRL